MTIWYQAMPLPDRRLVPSCRRIWELDFLRGVLILLMLVDHTFFDIAGMFGSAWTFSGVAGAAKAVEFAAYYWMMPLREWVHDGVLWGFLLLCGISTTLTHNNLQRVFKLALAAGILTCATVFAQQIGLAEDIATGFGVLHMLCLADLAAGAIYAVTKGNRLAAVLVPFVLAVGLYLLEQLYLGEHLFADQPAYLCVLHRNMGDMLTFSPGDYFPLLGDMSHTTRVLAVPYLSRVLVGVSLATLLYPAGRSLLPTWDGKWNKAICFLGRHTIWVVLLHQLLIPLLLALITGWFITPGNYGIF